MRFYDGLGNVLIPTSYASSHLLEWGAPYSTDVSQCYLAPNYACNETTKNVTFWVEYDFDSPVVVDHVNIHGLGSANYWDNIVKRASSVAFYKSNDGGATWQLVPSQQTGVGSIYSYGNYITDLVYQF